MKGITMSLKNNKASGKDSITAELLKYARNQVLEQLELNFKEIWHTKEITSDWRSAVIYPLHKKGSMIDNNDRGNRGILLLPVAYKILSKAIQNRVKNHINQQ